MGLDKWLKSEEADKKPKSKKPAPSKVKKIESKNTTAKTPEKPKIKLTKYTLTCPNSKCKYQKIIMKKQLSEVDKICPRCKKEMKIK
ncbi:MAG: hypothetical protein KGD65_00025 [Candidatus Lokiarchaeota archaeon]|nr:hypothetical protein [Candidatus Lokiarchaeota archaeon]